MRALSPSPVRNGVVFQFDLQQYLVCPKPVLANGCFVLCTKVPLSEKRRPSRTLRAQPADDRSGHLIGHALHVEKRPQGDRHDAHSTKVLRKRQADVIRLPRVIHGRGEDAAARVEIRQNLVLGHLDVAKEVRETSVRAGLPGLAAG